MVTRQDTTARGKVGEDLAVAYLEGLGYRILARNVRTRIGELDVVALDGDTLVIVEVRAVSDPGYLGRAAAAVTLAKARKVLRVARVFLAKHPELWRGRDVRLDALGVVLGPGTIDHLPGAIRWDMLGADGSLH